MLTIRCGGGFLGRCRVGGTPHDVATISVGTHEQFSTAVPWQTLQLLQTQTQHVTQVGSTENKIYILPAKLNLRH